MQEDKQVYLTQDELSQAIDSICDTVKEIFELKNTQYGALEDALYNLRAMLPLLRIIAKPEYTDFELLFYAAEILAEKHRVTLALNGFNDSNFEERQTDLIVYGMIKQAIYRAGQEGDFSFAPSPWLEMVRDLVRKLPK